MTEDDPRGSAKHGVSRRDFLRTIGGALGGVALTSAGSTNNGGGSLGAIPNGYVFYRVWTADDGAPWPGDPGFVNPVGELTPVTMMAGGTPFIYFHAHLTQSATDNNTSLGKGATPPDALFLVSLDYTRTPPVVTDLRVWSYQGLNLTTPNITGVPTDQLPLLISRIGTGDTNSAGHYATTLTCTDLSGTVAVKNAPGVYLIDPETKVWSRVARFGDPAPEGGQYGGIFGDVALADDDTVTFVGSTTDTSADSLGASQALFSVDRKHPTRQSRVLLRAGDLLPGTNAAIRSFGLVDVASDGGFVAQVAASRVDRLDRRPGTALIQGDLQKKLSSFRVLSASPHLVGALGARSDIVLGDTILGARIASGGIVAQVTHTTSHLHELTFRNRRGATSLTSNGGLLGGRRVASLGAPVVSDSALVYETVLLDDGSTVLTVSDGQTTQTLLRSGDSVQGKQITEILHGYHPRQTDSSGRLAFGAEFLKNASGDPDDPNNVESALVVGIPI